MNTQSHYQGACCDYEQIKELLWQALHTERMAVRLAERVLDCAIQPGLGREWQHCLEAAGRRQDALVDVLQGLGLDPEHRTPGCDVIAALDDSLNESIGQAQRGPDPRAAELAAAECLALLATRQQAYWTLLCEVARHSDGEARRVLEEACRVARGDKALLDHTVAGPRMLWLEALGLPSTPAGAVSASVKRPAAPRAPLGPH